MDKDQMESLDIDAYTVDVFTKAINEYAQRCEAAKAAGNISLYCINLKILQKKSWFLYNYLTGDKFLPLT